MVKHSGTIHVFFQGSVDINPSHIISECHKENCCITRMPFCIFHRNYLELKVFLLIHTELQKRRECPPLLKDMAANMHTTPALIVALQLLARALNHGFAQKNKQNKHGLDLLSSGIVHLLHIFLNFKYTIQTIQNIQILCKTISSHIEIV